MKIEFNIFIIKQVQSIWVEQEIFFAYIMTKPAGRWNITNDGDLTLSGTQQFGIIVSNEGYGVATGHIAEFENAEIFLNKEMKITGTESVGTVFKGWADLDGGSA